VTLLHVLGLLISGSGAWFAHSTSMFEGLTICPYL
jgi:hypothetical protein